MDDLGPLPKIHPRERLIDKAERKIDLVINEAIQELTTSEKIQVINHVLSRRISSIMKFCIRHERHGDPEKPGGLE